MTLDLVTVDIGEAPNSRWVRSTAIGSQVGGTQVRKFRPLELNAVLGASDLP